jgi:hypothetical protein
MGFQKPIVKTEITMQLLKAHGEICSAYNDGFVQWELKKELYEIKWLLEECLKREPVFSGEEEWVDEHHKRRMWSELKR